MLCWKKGTDFRLLWCGDSDNLYPCHYYIADEFDSYIVVSFINATLVLSIGETVEEVTDSGFLGTTPTLSCSQLGEDALLQVCKLISLFFNCFVL